MTRTSSAAQKALSNLREASSKRYLSPVGAKEKDWAPLCAPDDHIPAAVPGNEIFRAISDFLSQRKSGNYALDIPASLSESLERQAGAQRGARS